MSLVNFNCFIVVVHIGGDVAALDAIDRNIYQINDLYVATNRYLQLSMQL